MVIPFNSTNALAAHNLNAQPQLTHRYKIRSLRKNFVCICCVCVKNKEILKSESFNIATLLESKMENAKFEYVSTLSAIIFNNKIMAE